MFQAEDGIRDLVRSRGLGDVYKRQDDDILDDLAQTVLASGGEVVVASKDELPKGRIILAILKHQGTDLEKSEELNEFETLQERAVSYTHLTLPTSDLV